MEHSTLPKPRKINSLFPKKTLWRGTHRENITSINKYRLKMLPSLIIANVRCQNIGIEGFRDLIRAIANAKIINSILLEDTDLNPQQVAQILKRPTHSKSCRFLDDFTQGRPSRKTAKSLVQLSQNKNFTDLPIYIFTNPVIDESTACHFYQQLKGLNRLKTLTLDIPISLRRDLLPERLPRSLMNLKIFFRKRVGQQFLKAFASTTCHDCNQLKHFSLSFDRSYEIKWSDAEIWLATIRKFKTLEKFSLKKNFQEDQTIEGIQDFFNGFQHLSHIKILKLKFAHDFIWIPLRLSVDSFFSSLFTNLEYITQLEDLKLKLAYFPTTQNTHLQHFALALQKLTNLRNLACSFARMKSPNRAILSILQSIRNLKLLRVLDLTFCEVDISRSEVQTILSQIPSENLTSFKLILGLPKRNSTMLTLPKLTQGLSHIEFAAEKITNLWRGKSNSIFSNLCKFQSLSKLHLKLSNCNISTQDYKQLGQILKSMNSLSSLSIELPFLDPTDNYQGLQNFTSSFREITNLKELDIIFAADGVNDQQIGILASHLVGCPKLENFKLVHRYGNLLGSDSLEFLLAGLKDIQTLRFLHIIFNYRKRFEGKTLFRFLQGLAVLRNLEDLRFFDISGEALNQIIVDLPEDLKEYSNLKNLKKFIVSHYRYI